MSVPRLEVHTAPAHLTLDGRSTFAPTTATLVLGRRDAVLVDTLYMPEDVQRVADAVQASGRRLTTIFITHGHHDHHYGLAQILERFPDATPVAAPEVVDDIERRRVDDTPFFSRLFAELSEPPSVVPRPLDGDVIEVDDVELRVLHVGQADIDPNTSLHIPSIAAIVAGDVVYNGIHQMMVFGGPGEWEAWIASVDQLAALEPKVIVAGHKKPEASDEDATRILRESRAYIEDFADAAAAAASAEEIVAAMVARWPDHGNETTLHVSAAAAAARAQRT